MPQCLIKKEELCFSCKGVYGVFNNKNGQCSACDRGRDNFIMRNWRSVAQKKALMNYYLSHAFDGKRP